MRRGPHRLRLNLIAHVKRHQRGEELGSRGVVVLHECRHNSQAISPRFHLIEQLQQKRLFGTSKSFLSSVRQQHQPNGISSSSLTDTVDSAEDISIDDIVVESLDDDEDASEEASSSSSHEHRSEGDDACFEVISTADVYCRARVMNFIKKTCKKAGEVRVEMVSLVKRGEGDDGAVTVEPCTPGDQGQSSPFRSVFYKCSLDIHFPNGHGRRTAAGVATSPKDAEAVCTMHAERIIDAMGYPIFELTSKQERHAKSALATGRYAPMPGEPYAPISTQTPKPLLLTVDANLLHTFNRGVTAAYDARRQEEEDRASKRKTGSKAFTEVTHLTNFPGRYAIRPSYVLDSSCKSRVRNYLARRVESHKRVVSLFKSRGVKTFTVSVKLPVPHQSNATIVARGRSNDKAVALICCCMHAELMLDFYGIPIYDDPALQALHVQEAKVWGREAPLTGSNGKPVPLTADEQHKDVPVVSSNFSGSPKMWTDGANGESTGEPNGLANSRSCSSRSNSTATTNDPSADMETPNVVIGPTTPLLYSVMTLCKQTEAIVNQVFDAYCTAEAICFTHRSMCNNSLSGTSAYRVTAFFPFPMVDSPVDDAVPPAEEQQKPQQQNQERFVFAAAGVATNEAYAILSCKLHILLTLYLNKIPLSSDANLNLWFEEKLDLRKFAVSVEVIPADMLSSASRPGYEEVHTIRGRQQSRTLPNDGQRILVGSCDTSSMGLLADGSVLIAPFILERARNLLFLRNSTLLHVGSRNSDEREYATYLNNGVPQNELFEENVKMCNSVRESLGKWNRLLWDFQPDIDSDGDLCSRMLVLAEDGNIKSPLSVLNQRRMDPFCVQRIENYFLFRCLQRHEFVRERIVQGMYEASIDLPVPAVYGRVTAKGYAKSSELSHTAMYMHAELVLDALMIPIFDHLMMQGSRCRLLRSLGRMCPLHTSESAPFNTTLPPPLQIITAKERSTVTFISQLCAEIFNADLSSNMRLAVQDWALNHSTMSLREIEEKCVLLPVTSRESIKHDNTQLFRESVLTCFIHLEVCYGSTRKYFFGVNNRKYNRAYVAVSDDQRVARDLVWHAVRNAKSISPHIMGCKLMVGDSAQETRSVDDIELSLAALWNKDNCSTDVDAWHLKVSQLRSSLAYADFEIVAQIRKQGTSMSTKAISLLQITAGVVPKIADSNSCTMVLRTQAESAAEDNKLSLVRLSRFWQQDQLPIEVHRMRGRDTEGAAHNVSLPEVWLAALSLSGRLNQQVSPAVFHAFGCGKSIAQAQNQCASHAQSILKTFREFDANKSHLISNLYITGNQRSTPEKAKGDKTEAELSVESAVGVKHYPKPEIVSAKPSPPNGTPFSARGISNRAADSSSSSGGTSWFKPKGIDSKAPVSHAPITPQSSTKTGVELTKTALALSLRLRGLPAAIGPLGVARGSYDSMPQTTMNAERRSSCLLKFPKICTDGRERGIEFDQVEGVGLSTQLATRDCWKKFVANNATRYNIPALERLLSSYTHLHVGAAVPNACLGENSATNMDVIDAVRKLSSQTLSLWKASVRVNVRDDKHSVETLGCNRSASAPLLKSEMEKLLSIHFGNRGVLADGEREEVQETHGFCAGLISLWDRCDTVLTALDALHASAFFVSGVVISTESLCKDLCECSTREERNNVEFTTVERSITLLTRLLSERRSYRGTAAAPFIVVDLDCVYDGSSSEGSITLFFSMLRDFHHFGSPNNVSSPKHSLIAFIGDDIELTNNAIRLVKSCNSSQSAAVILHDPRNNLMQSNTNHGKSSISSASDSMEEAHSHYSFPINNLAGQAANNMFMFSANSPRGKDIAMNKLEAAVVAHLKDSPFGQVQSTNHNNCKLVEISVLYVPTEQAADVLLKKESIFLGDTLGSVTLATLTSAKRLVTEAKGPTRLALVFPSTVTRVITQREIEATLRDERYHQVTLVSVIDFGLSTNPHRPAVIVSTPASLQRRRVVSLSLSKNENVDGKSSSLPRRYIYTPAPGALKFIKSQSIISRGVALNAKWQLFRMFVALRNAPHSLALSMHDCSADDMGTIEAARPSTSSNPLWERDGETIEAQVDDPFARQTRKIQQPESRGKFGYVRREDVDDPGLQNPQKAKDIGGAASERLPLLPPAGLMKEFIRQWKDAELLVTAASSSTAASDGSDGNVTSHNHSLVVTATASLFSKLVPEGSTGDLDPTDSHTLLVPLLLHAIVSVAVNTRGLENNSRTVMFSCDEMEKIVMTLLASSAADRDRCGPHVRQIVHRLAVLLTKSVPELLQEAQETTQSVISLLKRWLSIMISPVHDIGLLSADGNHIITKATISKGEVEGMDVDAGLRLHSVGVKSREGGVASLPLHSCLVHPFRGAWGNSAPPSPVTLNVIEELHGFFELSGKHTSTDVSFFVINGWMLIRVSSIEANEAAHARRLLLKAIDHVSEVLLTTDTTS